MRTFVYFSSSARTSGNFSVDNLMDAGRMDIAIHVIINSFFLSHALRDDVVLHLIFYGMPDPPKHIEIHADKDTKMSKKDVANLIKKILYKYKPGVKTEAVPGCFIEKKSFLHMIEELITGGNEIFILDKGGKNIREAKIPENSVFVIGDQNGFPKKEMNRLKKKSNKISVGPKVYFASQVVSILNNELDIRGF
jgi:tRNA (pseudouridine54-N1)-methyltransferase